MEAERWPVDYDALVKGSIIPAETLERITQKKRDSADYALAVLNLKERVEQELFDRNKHWTLRIHKGEIKVLTDAEAAVHNHAEQVRARRAMHRRYALQLSVDVSRLEDDQRKQHDRNVELDGKYIQAMQDVRKRMLPTAHKRNVPALMQGE